jgi:hypothetical protein
MSKLYRFQPISIPGDDRLSMLKNDEVWFSDPVKFNDPFDLKPHIKNLVLDRWSNVPELNTAMRKALACLLADPAIYQESRFIDPDLLKEFQAWATDHAEDEMAWDRRLCTAIETRIAQFGVVCLTPQWDSSLMWAHYANNGQGFCIEYEIDWGKQPPDLRYVPVLYASETPEFCISEAMFTPHQFLKRVMATKHSDWAYEQEIRLVCLTGKGQSVKIASEFVRMTGLVAGYAMPDVLQRHLKQTAERLGVGAMKMCAKPNGHFYSVPLILVATSAPSDTPCSHV